MKPAQRQCRRHATRIDGKPVVRLRHGFSRSSDHHIGVALEAGHVLRALHLADGLGNGIEQANRHGRI